MSDEFENEGDANPSSEGGSRIRTILALLVPLGVYGALVSWQAYLARDQINPDAVCYIRNAQYLIEGQFFESIAGHRCPLISWLIAPLLYFGVDGLHAARIVLAIWGGLFVAASYLLLRRFPQCPGWLQVTTLVLIAIATVREAVYVITPDLLLSTILMAYAAVAMSPDLLHNKRRQFLCGILGGLGYWAKSYSLPFFVVHFTLVVALQRLRSGSERPTLGQSTLAWGRGMVAILIVSAPWIAALSWKYEKPTFSTIGQAAHNFVGPQEITEQITLGMREVPPGRIIVNETMELMSQAQISWSPFESREYLIQQVRVILRHAGEILSDLREFDQLGICLSALIFVPLVLWRPASSEDWFLAMCVLGTVFVYCSGFLPIYYEVRYIRGFLWPICCIYCLALVVPYFAIQAPKIGLPRWTTWLVTLLVVGSFAAGIRDHGRWQLRDSADRPGAVYRQLATQLQADGFAGPFATDERIHHLGIFLAYHLDEPFLGSPIEVVRRSRRPTSPVPPTVAQIEKVLTQYGVRSFVIEADWSRAKEFHEQTSWQFARELSYKSGALLVYVNPALAEGD